MVSILCYKQMLPDLRLAWSTIFHIEDKVFTTSKS